MPLFALSTTHCSQNNFWIMEAFASSYLQIWNFFPIISRARLAGKSADRQPYRDIQEEAGVKMKHRYKTWSTECQKKKKKKLKLKTNTKKKVVSTDSRACGRAQGSGPNRSRISGCAARICLRLVACGSSVSDQKKSVAIRLFCFLFKLTDSSSTAAVATATAGNTSGASDGRRPPSPPRPISSPKNKIKKESNKCNAMQCRWWWTQPVRNNNNRNKGKRLSKTAQD